MTTIISYEQPLTEVIRACLRLEQLFAQIYHHLKPTTTPDIQHIIMLMHYLLQILDRADLKAKLAKEIHSFHTCSTLSTDFSQQLHQLSHYFIAEHGRLGQRLRDAELFNILRLHVPSPSVGSFDLPLYHYWLQQPRNQCATMIQRWMEELNPLYQSITLILTLIRERASTDTKAAKQGFYQELLDAKSNLRMICVDVAHEVPAYPEISLGRHCLSVRFFIPNIENKPVQYPEDVTFTIRYCSA